jgi:metal-responsive CopG/Arc/MetJ family transcriptional regulator
MNFKLFEKTDIPLSLTISKTLLKRIDVVVEKEGVNKSSVVRVLLEKGLEYYENNSSKR